MTGADASDRLQRAFEAIDEVNAGDPEMVVSEGVARPKEQIHAEMMTSWVRRLDPHAEEAQLLAARAHHLRRWSLPRASYPDGRAGYLKWRTKLGRQHADEVAAILTGVGYDGATIARVQQIVRKEGRVRDPQVQTHEDALCLVFLSLQFDELARRLGDDHIVEVVRKTWAKMSDAGRTEALSLPLSDHGRQVVGRALEPD